MGSATCNWILYSRSKKGYYTLADSDHQVSGEGGGGRCLAQTGPKNKGSRSRG